MNAPEPNLARSALLVLDFRKTFFKPRDEVLAFLAELPERRRLTVESQ